MAEKEVKLSGGALAGVTAGGRRRRTTTRKNRQEGGDNSGALLQLKGQNVGDIAAPDTQALTREYQGAVAQALQQVGPDKIQQFGGKKQRGGDGIAGTIQLSSSSSPTTPGAPPAVPVVSGINPSQPAPVGGARVVLAPPKRKTRIALKPRKQNGGSEAVKTGFTGQLGGTRKARKIHLRVKGVTSRLAKAKKAKKEAMAASISTVRSKLEAAGVIKKGSKAPEHMLRNMYADLLITKKGL